MVFLKTLLLALVLLIIAVIGFFAVTDVKIEQVEKTETFTADRFNS